VNYGYDIANRLTSVGGMTYTWANNGNLLGDGVSTYTYDHANRLKSVVQGATTYGFGYNGLGDRLRQVVNGAPTNYTVDLAGGLTQVLADGTNSYLYGVGRIGEEQPGGWQYHLGDALGSVRQLASSGAVVTLARGYEPFGDTLAGAGSAATVWQFTGEARDGTGLTFLRARYYASEHGRFLTRDPWSGAPTAPETYTSWLYALGNPITNTDPSGRSPKIGVPPLLGAPLPASALPSFSAILTDSCMPVPAGLFGPPSGGYVEGRSIAYGYFTGGSISGTEIVYDYATMSRARFTYGGSVQGFVLGASAAVYVGNATGFRWDSSPMSDQIIDDYSGPFKGAYVGGGIPLNPMITVGGGAGYFHSLDWKLLGTFTYFDLGIGPLPFEGVQFETYYKPVPLTIEFYANRSGEVNTARLIGDILSGDQSPIPLGPISGLALNVIGGHRLGQTTNVLREALLFELYWKLTHMQFDPLAGGDE